MWEGPFRVISVRDNATLEVIPVQGKRRQRHRVHYNRVKPCYRYTVTERTDKDAVQIASGGNPAI
jgi:hypothetical protein